MPKVADLWHMHLRGEDHLDFSTPRDMLPTIIKAVNQTDPQIHIVLLG